jgi:hypothetical protein
MQQNQIDTIIQLHSNLVPERASREQQYCSHPEVLVVELQRLLLCKQCGLWIDPFEYMWRWAMKDWAVQMRCKQFEDEMRAIIARIAELERKERNLKARIRTAKRKLSTDAECG